MVEAQNEPAEQLTHTVANAAEYCPVRQATGAAVVVAQNDPAGQSVHVLLPLKAYRPDAQPKPVRLLRPVTEHPLPGGQGVAAVMPVTGQ